MEYRQLPHGTDNEKFGVLGLGFGGIGTTPVDEIEAIVFSGTKLNLDYYIEQTLDDDIVEEIYDYFKEEAQSDSLAGTVVLERWPQATFTAHMALKPPSTVVTV